MMEEAKRSVLKFDNPRVVEFDFKISPEFDSSKYKAFGINYQTSITKREVNIADVSLAVKVGLDGETVPFTIYAKVQATFNWEEGLETSIVDKLLNVNAKILLLSYLRPLVSHITVDAGYPPFIIPFLDFSEEND